MMLLQVAAAFLLLAGSELIFHALLALDRETQPQPVVRKPQRAALPARDLPRAA